MKKQKTLSKYLREIMYGGLDGIVTTFAVVAGFNGAGGDSKEYLEVAVVLLFGFSNLFSDATSMGLGNFLSVRSENKVKRTKHKAFLTSIATFSSFMFFGLLPLIPYIIFTKSNNLFGISIIFTLSALIILASLRSIATKERFLKVTIEVLIIGIGASLVSYFVGTLFKK